MSEAWKACDIRGIFPADVSADLFWRLGASVGSLLPVGGRVIIAGDFRTSTPSLKAALREGLLGAGVWVLDAGQIPTPIAYFAHLQRKTDAVMIVTASHNPPDHNGLKLMVGELPPIPEDFGQLRAQVERGDFRRHPGRVEIIDPVPDYKAHVLDRWKHLQRPDGMAVVLDAGNGAWSELAPDLFVALGFRAYPLFCKIDGTFPSRSPDCARPSNLAQLKTEVVRTGAQLGIAWDGDGDRVAFVDNSGSIVSTDEVSALMIRELLPTQQGANVVYDIKLSDLVRQAVIDCGGHPIMERSGHAFIKRTMIERNCLFGCEVSGHYFFRELGGGDDGLFTALFMTGFLRERDRSLAELRGTLAPFFVTPDLRIPLSILRYTEVVGRLRTLFPDARETTIDGVRWETGNGYVLARESVTEPLVTMRLEGRCEKSLRRLVQMCLETFPEVAEEISHQIDQVRGE